MEKNKTKITLTRNVFSKLSITFSGLTLIFFILCVNYIPTTINTNENIPVIPKWLVMSTEISCLVGVIFSIVSLIRKEQLKYWKFIAAVVNVFLFLFLIGTVGFAALMDWKRGQ